MHYLEYKYRCYDLYDYTLLYMIQIHFNSYFWCPYTMDNGYEQQQRTDNCTHGLISQTLNRFEKNNKVNA